MCIHHQPCWTDSWTHCLSALIRVLFLSPLRVQPPRVASHGVHLCQPLPERPGVGLPQQRAATPPAGRRRRRNAGLRGCREHQHGELRRASAEGTAGTAAHTGSRVPQSEGGVREFHIVQVSSSSQRWRLHRRINPASDRGKRSTREPHFTQDASVEEPRGTIHVSDNAPKTNVKLASIRFDKRFCLSAAW